ncbi:MAG: J domain-containing protein [Thermomicrobiales bacterium]
MTNQIAYTPLPEDIELADLLIQLQQSRDRLAVREQERSELELALGQFANQVKSRVGDMKEEIRSHRLRLEQIRQRLQRLKADPAAAPADIEKSLEEEEEAFTDPDAERGFHGRPDGPPRGSFNNTSAVSRQAMDEVIRIYRLLAKRHHPDLATTPEERTRRTELMLRINIAYRDQNLAVLQSLLLEVHNDLPLTQIDLTRQRISWTRNELNRIQKELRLTERRLDALLTSETYSLWRAELENQSALDDLERRTRERLERERARLDEASSQYARMAARRQVMLRRAASRTAASSAVGE